MANAPSEIIDLPISIDPIRLAKRGTILAGRLDLSQFERLGPSLAQADSRCQLNLAFVLNEKGRCFLEGSVSGCLPLICQRCLGPFEWSFELPIKLAVVGSEDEEAGLPEGFDMVLMQAEKINVQEVLEDELLLNVPNYPLHEDHCR